MEKQDFDDLVFMQRIRLTIGEPNMNRLVDIIRAFGPVSHVDQVHRTKPVRG